MQVLTVAFLEGQKRALRTSLLISPVVCSLNVATSEVLFWLQVCIDSKDFMIPYICHTSVQRNLLESSSKMIVMLAAMLCNEGVVLRGQPHSCASMRRAILVISIRFWNLQTVTEYELV